MNWQQLREKYPHKWLLVEAIGAFTRGSERVIDELELIGEFGDNCRSAWEQYKVLHHIDKNRELYVLHTDRPALSIGVMDAFGRDVATYIDN